jgi:hypothetical protein
MGVYKDKGSLKRTGTLEAMKKHEEYAESVLIDTAHFPEDVRPIVVSIWKMWKITPPSKRSKKGSEFSYWIECCRDIIDACAEHSPDDILREVHLEYKTRQAELNRPPFIVSGPCSLVKMCRAKAGQFRERNINNDNDGETDDSSFYF